MDKPDFHIIHRDQLSDDVKIDYFFDQIFNLFEEYLACDDEDVQLEELVFAYIRLKEAHFWWCHFHDE